MQGTVIGSPGDVGALGRDHQCQPLLVPIVPSGRPLVTPRPPLVIVLDRLVGRHGLCPSAAWDVLARAAARKGTTVDELASRIVAGVPSETEDLVAEEVAQLREALESRDVIGQAKGILMERHGIGADEAFARLVQMSQSGNVKLREIAENLVELRADLPSPEGDRLLG
jgi:hypothetical protein